MPFKITVDKEKCIGCGACAAMCPSSFVMKEGKSNVKKVKISKITCEQQAADACPVQAITVEQV